MSDQANGDNLKLLVVPDPFHGCWYEDLWKPRGVEVWGRAILEDISTYEKALSFHRNDSALRQRGIWISEAVRSWHLFVNAVAAEEITRLSNLLHNNRGESLPPQGETK